MYITVSEQLSYIQIAHSRHLFFIGVLWSNHSFLCVDQDDLYQLFILVYNMNLQIMATVKAVTVSSELCVASSVGTKFL